MQADTTKHGSALAHQIPHTKQWSWRKVKIHPFFISVKRWQYTKVYNQPLDWNWSLKGGFWRAEPIRSSGAKCKYKHYIATAQGRGVHREVKLPAHKPRIPNPFSRFAKTSLTFTGRKPEQQQVTRSKCRSFLRWFWSLWFVSLALLLYRCLC